MPSSIYSPSHISRLPLATKGRCFPGSWLQFISPDSAKQFKFGEKLRRQIKLALIFFTFDKLHFHTIFQKHTTTSIKHTLYSCFTAESFCIRQFDGTHRLGWIFDYLTRTVTLLAAAGGYNFDFNVSRITATPSLELCFWEPGAWGSGRLLL